ncbi:MAG: hypothetical protein GXO84_02305 [Chlorobi bacterium]|nr:hypothetical protein [Chlorobiota bacterium]
MEKQKLNSTIVYVLAILGFLCCCFGGIGFIFAGIAFFMAQSKLKEAYANPENYENIEGMKTAKIIALVVLIINLLFLIRVIYVISTVGWDVMMEQSREMIEQFQ